MKKNPADLTGRNRRALIKRLTKLELDVKKLKLQVRELLRSNV